VPIAALIAVLLLAFVALAIDGGRGYLDRRNLQSTADMAALSGAAELGTAFKINLGANKARTAAVHEAVSNLPGTSYPAGYDGSTDKTGDCNKTTVNCLVLGNKYTMDVSATITQVYVKVYHQLSLTFGVSAGFGPFITPTAEATAVNGKIPFAVILFRTQCTGATGNGCGNLTESGGKTVVNVTSADFPQDTADALTNESICPAPGVIDFADQGNQYAFNPSGNGQYGVAGTSCGDNTNLTNVLCTGGVPTTCVSPAIPMVTWPNQLADPLYPEPSTSTACTPGTSADGDLVIDAQCNAALSNGATDCLPPGIYNSIDVKKGDLVLRPGIFRVTGLAGSGSNFQVDGSNAAAWTVDQYKANLGTLPCGLSAVPADPGVILELPQPANSNGAANELKVKAGGTFKIAGSAKYNHVTIYVENHPGGESSTPNPFTDWGNNVDGSSVVNFQSGSSYNIKGAVYGYADNMTFAGGTATQGVGQILAWTITLAGGGIISQTYDPNQLPSEYGLLK